MSMLQNQLFLMVNQIQRNISKFIIVNNCIIKLQRIVITKIQNQHWINKQLLKMEKKTCADISKQANIGHSIRRTVQINKKSTSEINITSKRHNATISTITILQQTYNQNYRQNFLNYFKYRLRQFNLAKLTKAEIFKAFAFPLSCC